MSGKHLAVPPPCARLLSRIEAAAYVRVSLTTFDKMVGDGLMPKPKRVYTRKLWDVRGLDLAVDALPSEDDDESENEWDTIYEAPDS